MPDPMAITEGLSRFAGRGPCTDAERRAGNWLHDELRANGHEAWVETLWLRPQWALSLALHATVGVVASLVAVAAPLPALIAAGATALSLAIEATGRAGPLRWLLPRRATQNVLVPAKGEAAPARTSAGAPDEVDPPTTSAGAPDEAAPPTTSAGARGRAVTLLICARYDAPREGLVTRDGPRRLAARVRRAAGGWGLGARAWVALACAAVAGCAAARLAGAEGPALGFVQFIPTLVLLGALAAAADAAVARIGPGDNDTGVGVAVTLHDELSRDPPERLSPALLLYGAGEGGPAALRAHLRHEKLDPRATVLLELGPCGAGAPAFAAAHPGVRAACAAAGAPRVPARGVARGRRTPAGWIGCLDETGIAPRSRRPDDPLDRLDPAAVQAALAYARASADELAAAIAA